MVNDVSDFPRFMNGVHQTVSWMPIIAYTGIGAVAGYFFGGGSWLAAGVGALAGGVLLRPIIGAIANALFPSPPTPIVPAVQNGQSPNQQISNGQQPLYVQNGQLPSPNTPRNQNGQQQIC